PPWVAEAVPTSMPARGLPSALVLLEASPGARSPTSAWELPELVCPLSCPWLPEAAEVFESWARAGAAAAKAAATRTRRRLFIFWLPFPGKASHDGAAGGATGPGRQQRGTRRRAVSAP